MCIYIYIYIYVCVCVCVIYSRRSSPFQGAADFQAASPEGRYIRFGVHTHTIYKCVCVYTYIYANSKPSFPLVF